jgi:hypothetical protein
VTGYGLDDREVGVPVPVGQEFSFLHVVQTGSFPEVKRPRREPDHSPTASAEVKKL